MAKLISRRTTPRIESSTTSKAPENAPSKAKKLRTVKFPNPGAALRQHVAALDDTAAPLGIRLPPPPIAEPKDMPAAVSRGRALIDRLRTKSNAGLERQTVRTLSQDASPSSNERLALGRQLRALRRGQDLTQEALAQASGVGRRFIIDLENGKPSVELRLVLKVIAALGYTLRLEPIDRD